MNTTRPSASTPTPDAASRVLLAIAQAAAPGGRYAPSPSLETLAAARAIVVRFFPEAPYAYAGMVRALDLAAIPLTGRPLSALPLDRRTAALETLMRASPTHWLARGVTMPLRLAQVLAANLPTHLGSELGAGPHPAAEPHRWAERLMDAREVADGETLEVDAVIVGSGAGGAPTAHALARRGHAVLIVEEGAFFDRPDFHGRPSERALDLQRQHALLGRGVILMPTGVTVGGSTTINSGTCLPTPDHVLARWRAEQGLVELTPEVMAPFFRSVEAMLEVTHAHPSTLGGCARVVARGAEALGWSHGPLPRNAPGCDGQGTCCFGCPTDAKRSTNVSYVPAALESGAMLMHHARVDEVLLAGGKAVGVMVRATDADGRTRRVRVLASAVVLSAGAIGTPGILLKQKLANRSGQVGRNLTVHPATSAWARFAETIDGWREIPQGYGVDAFVDEGIRMEGSFVPLDVAAATVPLVGPAWTRFVDHFDHMACFGFMIEETSRGRVMLDPTGRPQVAYVINDVDRHKLLRGTGLLARLFLAAGAEEVFTPVHGLAPLTTEADVDRLMRDADHLSAAHLDVAAFHPLGTARMGVDPRKSVVGPNHEAHDVPQLFVIDGSVVSGPLGVNPQVTIMALAERAAPFVERRIDTAGRSAKPRAAAINTPPQVEFTETMQGPLTLLDSGRLVEATFAVRAGAERLTAGQLASSAGAALVLEGTATVPGVATRVPCVGSLAIRPRQRTGTLVYDLDFEDDAGVALHLHGEKSVSPLHVLHGMTTLVTEVRRVEDQVVIATGTMYFAMRDLVPWLTTWRVRRGR